MKLSRNLKRVGTGSIVQLQITLNSGYTSPTTNIAPMKYNKKCAMVMVKDDGYVEDYTMGYAYLKGGVLAADGQTYPGVTYTDGCGKAINYKMSFAINSNAPRTGASPYEFLTSWTQLRTMADNDFDLVNHSWEHSGYNKLVQVKQNEYNIFDNTGFRTRTFVVPTNDEGYANTAPYLGYLNVGSSFGDPARDDFEGADDANNIYGVYWGASTLLNTRTFNRHGTLMNRFYTEWRESETLDLKAFIDSAINKSEAGTANYIAHWFSHVLSGQGGGYQEFKDLIQYIKNHPKNNDTIWIPGQQEFSEYYEVKELTLKSESRVGNVLTVTLDMSQLSDKGKYRDLSLLVTGGVIDTVTVTGVDSFTYSTSKGLINLYKKNPEVSNPHDDILPPQIIGMSRNENRVKIVYDRPVIQTLFSNSRGAAYRVNGNTITNITSNGSGTEWTLTCQNEVQSTTVDYRMQRGNARDADGLKVCTYIGYPVS